MNNKCLKLAVAATLFLMTLSVNAATYNLVNENYILGVDLGSTLDFNVDLANKTNLDSGEYTDKLTLTAVTPDTWVLNSSYNFITTATTSTDQLFGTFTVTRILSDSKTDSLAKYFTVRTQYTGGTGLFSGATGNGSFEIDTIQQYSPSSLVTQVNYLYATITTPVAAVPESDTSEMVLMGVGLIGFMARRRKNKQA